MRIKSRAVKKKHGSHSKNDSLDINVKRTPSQAAAEKKEIARFIKDLKSDKRTNWEIITDDPDYTLILRAPLNSDLSGYAEYGWSGPFKYLEEAYSEAGPFSKTKKTIPYREIGLVRSGNVLSNKDLFEIRAKKLKLRYISDHQKLIKDCREIWDNFYNYPTKKNLISVFNHLQLMSKSDNNSVKKEMSICLKAAMKDANRLGMNIHHRLEDIGGL